MRVAGQALAVHLLAEIEQLLLAQAAFQKRACIHARGHMALDKQAVAAMVLALGMPKMVKACAKQAGQGREGANVAAQIAAVRRVVAIGFDDHGHGVPAHIGAQTLFHLQVARGALFMLGLDGVDIARRGRKRHVDAFLAGVLEQLL